MNIAITPFPTGNSPIFRINEQETVEQTVSNQFGLEYLRQQVGLYRAYDIDTRIFDKNRSGFRLADYFQRLSTIGRKQIFDKIIPITISPYGIEQSQYLIDDQCDSSRIMLMYAHHRLRSKIRYDGRYQLGLFQDGTIFRISTVTFVS